MTLIQFLLHYYYWYLLCFYWLYKLVSTRYRTRHFLNNSNPNEDIVKTFEQEYVRCVRNDEECVCGVCSVCIAPNCCDTEQRSASYPACLLPDAPLCTYENLQHICKSIGRRGTLNWIFPEEWSDIAHSTRQHGLN